MVKLKIIRAKRLFPIFIFLAIRASETDSSDFESEQMSNLHTKNEKLRNVILITI